MTIVQYQDSTGRSLMVVHFSFKSEKSIYGNLVCFDGLCDNRDYTIFDDGFVNLFLADIHCMYKGTKVYSNSCICISAVFDNPVEQTVSDRCSASDFWTQERKGIAITRLVFLCFRTPRQTVNKASVHDGGIVVNLFYESEGIGGEQTADEVAVAVKVGKPIVLVTIRLVVPLAASIFGFAGVGQKVVVEPDIIPQFVILALFVCFEGKNELTGVMDDVRISLSAIAPVKSDGHLTVPRPAAIDMQAQLLVDFVIGGDGQADIAFGIDNGRRRLGIGLATDGEHVFM